jgi:EAL domain-containing protein (putative c-di-GMP-specific phosphodiesterase class I)
MLQALAAPYHLDQGLAYVSASIGITLYPDDAAEIESLLMNADQAMYAAKARGRSRVSYFKPAMQKAASLRVQLANDLRGALAQRQFRVVYQPIIDLSNGLICKAEALLRWDHPERGAISPADFIPIAEETGLIIEIGDWVFRQAATMAAECQRLRGVPLQISVNKSPVQFREGQGRPGLWRGHLAELGLSGDSIAIEITEGLLLDAGGGIQDALSGFRGHGIQVSIDDFGTGYSSLSYLKKFNIDSLKIDQSFVQGLAPESNDMALCEAIIVMAHRLGIRVIAEGIETAQQQALLTDAGCDFGQGYLISRPISADDFASLIGAERGLVR